MFRMPRVNSIAEFADRGERVRAWCWRCARGHEWLPWQVPKRLWPLPLDKAALRFRCRECRRSDRVQLLPSRIEIPRELMPKTAAGMVWGIWNEAKRRKKGR